VADGGIVEMEAPAAFLSVAVVPTGLFVTHPVICPETPPPPPPCPGVKSAKQAPRLLTLLATMVTGYEDSPLIDSGA
jgi:hypothetical protein